ncbi:MAG: VWA domain-containing protein [Desulfobacterales bacterium]|nr:VWA domain-containing protein [Desulfobacterales bacterium]
MKFVQLEMLLSIWAIPVLLMVFLYGMHRRRTILSQFASNKGLKAIVPEVDFKKRWIKAALMLCTLFFTALALAGPQYGYKWEEIERKGIDIILALDCSKSMLAEDMQPTRLDRAKREVFDLLNMLQGDRVGLVAFAGTAFLQCPLTIDYETFHLFLNTLTPDFLPVGGTDIAAAIQTALSGFNEKDNSEKAVILITDGENTGGDAVKAAETASKAGVKLFCIGVGSAEGVPVPDKQGGFKKDITGNIVLTHLDEETLKKIAVLTGGTYVRSVAGDMDLDIIYLQEIRAKMDAATLSSGRKQVWEDRFQWFLSIALIALIVDFFLPAVKKNKMILILLLIPLVNVSAAFAASNYKNLQQGLEAYEKGDYEKSLKFFIDAQLENPERSEIYYNIGNAYYKTGDFESALKNYQEALKCKDNALKAKTFYNLGNTNYRNGKLEDAVTNFQQALKINPEDKQAKQNLEFVKKIIAQQKQPQTQNQPRNNQEEKDKDKEKTEDQKSKSENQSQKPDAGKSRKQEAGPDKSSQTESSDQEKDTSKGNNNDQDRNQSAESMSLPESDTNGPDKNQAEKMLNRLRDMPGRAMIPSYREKYVEKDW